MPSPATGDRALDYVFSVFGAWMHRIAWPWLGAGSSEEWPSLSAKLLQASGGLRFAKFGGIEGWARRLVAQSRVFGLFFASFNVSIQKPCENCIPWTHLPK